MAESSQEFEEPPPEADSDSPHSEAIIDVYATLRNKLEPQNLLGDLYQERLITDTEMARIKAASVVYEKNDELLEAVRRRSGKDISKFCQILLREQEHCGIVLKGGKLRSSRMWFQTLLFICDVCICRLRLVHSVACNPPIFTPFLGFLDVGM